MRRWSGGQCSSIADRLREVGHALVVEARTHCWHLTRSDLVKALAQRGRNASVTDIIRRDCLTANQSEMLETVLGRLQGRSCHTIPVLENGALIGLVTMDNIGEFLMIQAAERRRSP